MNKGKKFSLKMLLENQNIRWIFTWVFQICLVLILAAFLAIGFGRSVVMQESSMEPTLSAGDHFLINQVIYHISSPKRGDIIVFKTGGQESSIHIKRIIGLPGESIQIKNGKILINGETYIEKNNFSAISDAGLASDVINLGMNEYFVLSDDRTNSEDSRYSEIGNIKKKNIIGKLWFTVSPPGEFGFLKE